MAEQQTPRPVVVVSHPFTIYTANGPNGWFAHAYHGTGGHLATREGLRLTDALKALAVDIETWVAARPSSEETSDHGS